MRDERVAPKGWPKELRFRRSGKGSQWHDEWRGRQDEGAAFQPEGRKEGSDYNLHHVDLEAPPASMDELGRRMAEIDGRDPDTRRPLPEPDAAGRFRGAVLGAAAGDALARARREGAVRQRSWKPALQFRFDYRPLVEYAPARAVTESSSVIQLLTFTLEAMIRANSARRRTLADDDPIPEVQHAYLRWLHTQRVPWGQRGLWQQYGAPFANHVAEPDGWLVHNEILYKQVEPDPEVLRVLEEFTRTGRPGTRHDEHVRVRGSSALVPAAAAVVWSHDASEVFRQAADVAALTHNHPDDHLPAGALAALYHQQIRDVPFSGCLDVARAELERWPGGGRTLEMIERALNLSQETWSPANPQQVQERFPGRGEDGAEALGLALYCAVVSDYVREALLLALNYTGSSSVAAAAGLLTGAECGEAAIPPDLRRAPSLGPVLDAVAADVLREFSPAPPTEQAWLSRYPAW